MGHETSRAGADCSVGINPSWQQDAPWLLSSSNIGAETREALKAKDVLPPHSNSSIDLVNLAIPQIVDSRTKD